MVVRPTAVAAAQQQRQLVQSGEPLPRRWEGRSKETRMNGLAGPAPVGGGAGGGLGTIKARRENISYRPMSEFMLLLYPTETATATATAAAQATTGMATAGKTALATVPVCSEEQRQQPQQQHSSSIRSSHSQNSSHNIKQRRQPLQQQHIKSSKNQSNQQRHPHQQAAMQPLWYHPCSAYHVQDMLLVFISALLTK